MSAITELRLELISKIKMIEDEDQLKILLSWLDDVSTKPYALSVEEEASIKRGLKDLDEGKIHSHEEVMSRTKKWLDGQ